MINGTGRTIMSDAVKKNGKNAFGDYARRITGDATREAIKAIDNVGKGKKK